MVTIKVDAKASDILKEIFEKQKDQVNEYMRDQIFRSFNLNFLCARISQQPEPFYYATREKWSVDLLLPDGEIIFDVDKEPPE